jgi:mannosyltransferase
MAKKGMKEKKSTKAPGVPEGDLDSGFDAGIHTWHDVSFQKVWQAVKHSRYVQILIALTLIGLFLRFYQITFNSIWLDEAATLKFSDNSLLEIWNITANGEFNPPLFHWIEHFMLYFGNSEFVLRFVPAILGTLSIPLFYLVGNEFLDRNCGIIMATLLTFAPFHIFYSQEARAYSTMLFFISLALIFYFLALHSNTWKSWALFGFFSSLAFWAHFYAFIPVISLFFIAAGLNAGKIRDEVRFSIPLITGAGVFLLVSLPLIAVVSGQFLIRTSKAPTYGIQGPEIIAETLRQLSGYSDIILIIYLAVFVIGTFAVFRIKRNRAYFLIAMILIPLVISWGLSYRMPMIPRYLIYLLPIYFMGIAASYRPVIRLVKSKRGIYLFMVALIVVNIPFLVTYYQNPTKDDWRGFSAMIRETSRPGDIIVLMPDYNNGPFDYYYQNATAGTIEYGSNTVQRLEEIYGLKGEHRIFYVVTGDINAVDPKGTTLEWLGSHAKTVGRDTGIYLLISD